LGGWEWGTGNGVSGVTISWKRPAEIRADHLTVALELMKSRAKPLVLDGEALSEKSPRKGASFQHLEDASCKRQRGRRGGRLILRRWEHHLEVCRSVAGTGQPDGDRRRRRFRAVLDCEQNLVTPAPQVQGRVGPGVQVPRASQALTGLLASRGVLPR